MTAKVHRLTFPVKPVKSFEAVAMARSVPGLHPSQTAVLVRLCEHVNPANGGRVWPSIGGKPDSAPGNLVDTTGFTRRTVQYALRRLEAAGYIRTVQRGGRFRGRKYGTLYELQFAAMRAAVPAGVALPDIVPATPARAAAVASLGPLVATIRAVGDP